MLKEVKYFYTIFYIEICIPLLLHFNKAVCHIELTSWEVVLDLVGKESIYEAFILGKSGHRVLVRRFASKSQEGIYTHPNKFECHFKLFTYLYNYIVHTDLAVTNSRILHSYSSFLIALNSGFPFQILSCTI